MPSRPYFTLSEHSFEKNSGYKSTVYALAELIDNSVEAEASKIAVVLMVNRDKRLLKIAVADNGKGMSPIILQNAICEKSGEHLARQSGASSAGRKKFGKYGVGLPKASISQANKFTVYSWKTGDFKTSYCNGINIKDVKWIKSGAQVSESKKGNPPEKWIEVSGLRKSSSGTFVLWEDLDGLTWSRARSGENKGLIPQLDFQIGRTYRKFLQGENPELQIIIKVIDESFNEIEEVRVSPNDPLYITKGAKVPRKRNANGVQWPPDDPLFEETSEENSYLEMDFLHGLQNKKIVISWKRSAAKIDTFAKVNGVDAGDMPHGKHAARNVGLSLLREGREVELSQALCNPSESRERWFGVEIDFPHELDTVLGMTNNKQSYTKLDQILRDEFKSYVLEGESTSQCLSRMRHEDYNLAICLEIAWKIQEVWATARSNHFRMRESSKLVIEDDNNKAQEEAPQSPEATAEVIASKADGGLKTEKLTQAEREKERIRFVEDLIKSNVPRNEALQIADRLLKQGLTYAIVNRGNLGSPFFNISSVVDAKIIELNEDHPVHPYLLSSINISTDKDMESLSKRLKDTRIALLLMLEAWAKTESEARSLNQDEQRLIQRFREDWGRSLETFVRKFNESHEPRA